MLMKGLTAGAASAPAPAPAPAPTRRGRIGQKWFSNVFLGPYGIPRANKCLAEMIFMDFNLSIRLTVPGSCRGRRWRGRGQEEGRRGHGMRIRRAHQSGQQK